MTVKAQDTQDATSTDRIEKKFDLRAPRSRVWRAITSAEEFSQWFRMNLDGAFVEGKTVRGKVTHKNWEHACPVEMTVERIEPERYFAYRWHPFALDPAIDYSAEPTTLVEFILEEGDAGTSVTIIESGFDQLPLDRRAEAYRMNNGGWDGQSRNLTAYVA